MDKINSRARRLLRALAVVSIAAALHACAAENGMGLHFPHGDANRGREAFVALRCQFCHEIEGLDLPAPIVAETRVVLGGQAARAKRYGDLMTSIVNPSHALARGYPRDSTTLDGESLMSRIDLNEVLTVQQLVDIVAFLRGEYE
jgi:hypothetical protein